MKLDRLMGILTVLLQNEQVTAPYLAEKFEVSRRTITRDIDALCQAGIPVVTRQGGGGGIGIAEGYKLDKRLLTYDELGSIVASLKGLGSVTGGTQVERTLDKLSAKHGDTMVSLQESIVIDLASNYKGSLTAKIGEIKAAIQGSQEVAFTYYSDRGEMRRRIEPYFIAFQWTSWYLFGFCLDRQDWRMFKLARLWDLQTLDRHFTPREIPPERRDFSARLTDHLRYTAIFEASEKYQVVDCYGPDAFTELPDGRIQAELFYTNKDFAVRWLLGFGSRVQVIDPPEMVAELREAIEKMRGVYT